MNEAKIIKMLGGQPPYDDVWKYGWYHQAIRRKYEDAAALMDVGLEYIRFCQNHPLQGEKVAFHEGKAVRTHVNKIRAMTITGLCLFMGITVPGWHAWKRDRCPNDPMWKMAMDNIEQAIYDQKFGAAAADLLNAQIVMRDLGLKERTDITSNEQPLQRIERRVVKPDASE